MLAPAQREDAAQMAGGIRPGQIDARFDALQATADMGVSHLTSAPQRRPCTATCAATTPNPAGRKKARRSKLSAAPARSAKSTRRAHPRPLRRHAARSIRTLAVQLDFTRRLPAAGRICGNADVNQMQRIGAARIKCDGQALGGFALDTHAGTQFADVRIAFRIGAIDDDDAAAAGEWQIDPFQRRCRQRGIGRRERKRLLGQRTDRVLAVAPGFLTLARGTAQQFVECGRFHLTRLRHGFDWDRSDWDRWRSATQA